jgi:O-antigen ligase
MILTTSTNSQLAVQYRFNNFLADPSSGGYGEDTELSRTDLMAFSFSKFSQAPFFGVGGNIRTSIYEGNAGGHSSAVDFLAILGLLGGGGAFIFLVFLFYRNAFKHLKKDGSFYNSCNLSIMTCFLIGGIMNPYWQSSILMTLFLFEKIYNIPYDNHIHKPKAI